MLEDSITLSILIGIWSAYFIGHIILGFIAVRQKKSFLDGLTVFFQRQHLVLTFSAVIITGYIYSPVIKELINQAANYRYISDLHFSQNVNFPIIGHYFVLWPLVAAIVAIVLNLFTIFLYNRRPLQIVLCWLSVVPLLFSFCYIYYQWSVGRSPFDQYFYFGNLCPLIAIVFIFTAMFYIRKDEELVKSVDRLR